MEKKIMPRHFILELCAIDLSKLDKKLRISPVDKATGLDGRVFQIDGAAVLNRLNANGLQLVLNIAHEYGGKAAGWFTDFELREDGIYAALKLNAIGKDLLETEQFKYLSPEYLIDYDTNEVDLIVGVGLVNQPNLLNEALNHLDTETTTMNDKEKNQLQTATAQVDTLTTENNALSDENKTLRDRVEAQAKARRLQTVDNAISEGKLKPAKKDYALTLEENSLNTYLALEAQDTSTTENNGIDKDDDTSKGDVGSDVFNQLEIAE